MNSCIRKSLLRFGLIGLLLAGSGGAFADNTPAGRAESNAATTSNIDLSLPNSSTHFSSFTDSSPRGLDRHRLTDGRSLIGWKLSDKLYFGRAKKESATVAFVWEQSHDQRLSLSTNGLKFTRRFK